MIAFFDHPDTLTISMWDYSWLQCGHPGGAFEDLPRRVAEAAERGYNALRVDVFPHRYPESRTHFRKNTGNRRIRTWGDVFVAEGYDVDVRAKVMELADLCRKENILLGLDTWQSRTELARHIEDGGLVPAEQEERLCRDWSSSWARALRIMREDGVLERAAWIAPLNEVPLFLGQMLASVKISDPQTRHEGQTEFRADLPELDAIFQRINTWLGEEIKEVVRSDSIPLAYSALGAENYADRLTDLYDLVDVHFMPDVFLRPSDREALDQAGAGASGFSLHAALDGYNLAVYGAAWERALENNYPEMLHLAHNYAQAALDRCMLPSGKRLAALVSECYGPCNFPDHPSVSWEGYKNWNADAARIFSQYEYAGLSLSNHAEPIFSLWDDVGWHRRGNAFLKAAFHGNQMPSGASPSRVTVNGKAGMRGFSCAEGQAPS
jgi:hypothetical protein